MSRYKVLCEFIDNFPCDEPIFVEDCLKYFEEKEMSKENNKDLYVYLYRLIQERKIKKYSDGIYYKPSQGTFGERTLNMTKVIDKKYLYNGENVKGYFSGHHLFNLMGLTTQMPGLYIIVTNECPNKNQYKNEKLNVIIRKPKIEITNENYLYLQLLDVLSNKDNVRIEVENEKEIIYDFIKRNNLELEKIMYYAKKTNNKHAIERMYDIAC